MIWYLTLERSPVLQIKTAYNIWISYEKNSEVFPVGKYKAYPDTLFFHLRRAAPESLMTVTLSVRNSVM